jgi:hypothetical protein
MLKLFFFQQLQATAHLALMLLRLARKPTKRQKHNSQIFPRTTLLNSNFTNQTFACLTIHLQDGFSKPFY